MRGAPSAAGLAAFALGFGLALVLAAAPMESAVGSEAKLFEAVNRIRRERHLPALAARQELARVALEHARDMARSGYLDHINRRGQNPLDRVRAAGVEGMRLLAENIGSSSVSGDRIQAVVEEWMASKVHRENLLNPAFNATGLAVIEAPGGRTLVVQLYATFE